MASKPWVSQGSKQAGRRVGTSSGRNRKDSMLKPMPELQVVKIPTDELVEYRNNAKLHPSFHVEQIVESIEEFGFNNPILAWHNDEGEAEIVAGHGRLMAARKLGIEELPVVFLDHLSDEARRAYLLVDNQLTMNTGFDLAALSDELEAITSIDMSQFDFDVSTDGEFEGLQEVGDVPGGILEERFGFVPFSIIDASSQRWQSRKREWLATGIRSELGRDGELLFGKMPENIMKNQKLAKQTSIFDPVLCELDYTWFTNHGDSILDPFAGGSVRGIVAGMMGRSYTGIDLREEQVSENIRQSEELHVDGAEWFSGDSLDMDNILGDRMFDHVFTCPPYGDLEVYSSDERDISNMSTDDFNDVYSEIIRVASRHLRDDRFMTVVVGNYRDRHGSVQDLQGVTVRAAESAGLRYYNDCILETAIGTLPIRTGNQFSKTRKVGRRHQYVLNFVKGDERAATVRLEEIEVPDLEQFMDEGV